MSNILYISFFLGCFIFSALGTGLALKLLRRKKIMDVPNSRSNHSQAVPRGGGIAVICVIVLAYLILSIFINGDFLYIWPVFAAVIFLAAVSWIDDLRNLSIKWRLLAQLISVAAGMYVIGLRPQDLPHFPLWLGMILIGLAWMWFINLYNFMDGIDGITGSQSIAIAVGLAIVANIDYHLPQEIGFYASVITAVSLGFLIWNWHPARIFIGDVGSIPLGFILGWLLIETASRGHLVETLLITAYYLSDSGYTVVKRLLKGEKIWEAHSQHFYQQAARLGKNHAQVVRVIIILNALLLCLVAACLLEPKYKLVFLAAGYALTALVLAHFHGGKKVNGVE